MLRVLHFGKFYPPDTGGIESVTATLAKGAARAEHSVEVLCFAEHAHSDAVDEGVRICRVPQSLKLSSQPLGWRYMLRGWQLAKRADLVHVHTPNMLAAFLAVCLPQRIKVVVHWHSDVVGKGLLAKLLAPLETKLLNRADRIICTSSAYALASPTVAPFKEKIAIVPIGVPDPKERLCDSSTTSTVKPTESLDEFIAGRPIILCVGRLVPYKGYATLIEAAKCLKADAAIVVVGGGPLASALQTQIEAAGMQHRVRLAGRLPDEVLVNLQSRARVFCMPSVERSEAFGVALVEAMACGLPLVATNIIGSGVPWVNEDGVSGLNVSPGNATELAAALDRVLQDDGLRTRLSVGARARFEALFTEEATVLATLKVYQQVISQQNYNATSK